MAEYPISRLGYKIAVAAKQMPRSNFGVP